jgi:tRNA threonylcarbamoyladenosine biosynthesis protein TsaB
MLLLVTNTSGKHGSVALARSGANKSLELVDEVPLVGGTFSAQLVPQISALLYKHRFRRTDIDAFIVVSGPGSFTGLRVGLAAIKALAEILQKPIVPVSLLEVVALASGTRGTVIAALDAGRNEVFAGEYEIGDSARLVAERLLSRDELLTLALKGVVATSDDKLAQAVQVSGTLSVKTALPTARMVAEAALWRLEAGDVVSPDHLEANYIRRSDAEIFSQG